MSIVRSCVRSVVRSPVRGVFGGDDVFGPASLFSSGAQGAWYDPSDFSTLFQNSTGTTPVTAVEQPVRLMLDRSRGLVLGGEAVSAGVLAFNPANWNAGAGWTANGNGTATFVAGADQNIEAVSVVTSGITYRLTITVSNLTTGSISVRVGNNSIGDFTVTANGSYTLTLNADGTSILFRSQSVSGTNPTISGLSVRELPGNHALAPNDASRPVLRATNRLDFDGSDDRIAAAAGGGGTAGMLFVAGINLDAVGAASTIWSDTGTNTGYRVRINASNQVEVSAGNGSAYTTVATAETLASGTNYVIAAWHDGTNLNARLGLSGAIAQAAFATATAGTAAFTLGMDNGATSSFLNGKLYNAVYVRNFAGTLSDVNATAAYVSGTMA